MPTLLHYSLCPFSRSIRLLLAEMGRDVEFEEERPWDWRPEFIAVNPAGALPVLLVDDGPAICGSYAISEYLGESGGVDGGIAPFPGSRSERAEIRRLVDWFHRKFETEVTGYLLEEKVYRRYQRNGASPEIEALKAGRANLRYHLAYIAHLTATRNWLAGETPSFADLAAAAQLSAIDYLGDVPWDEFPESKDWYARIKSRPSFRSLLADRLPGLIPSPSYANLDF